MDEIKRFRGEYFFLSNFYPVFVHYNNIRFPSVEHAFQAAKTLDADEQMLFKIVPTAAEAKKRGRKVKLRPDWEQIKLAVMEELLRDKFSQPELRQKLLATGDALIVEGNTHGDRFWGQVNGEGKNMLGLLLMKIRAELAQDAQQ